MPWYVVTAQLRKSTGLFNDCLRLGYEVVHPVLVKTTRKRNLKTGRHESLRTVINAFGRYMLIEAPQVQAIMDDLPAETYVRVGGEPARVRNEVMEQLRSRTERLAGIGDVLKRAHEQVVGKLLFSLGTSLNIVSGPLIGSTGVVTEPFYKGQSRQVPVQVELLGSSHQVKIDLDDVMVRA